MCVLQQGKAKLMKINSPVPQQNGKKSDISRFQAWDISLKRPVGIRTNMFVSVYVSRVVVFLSL